jgi:hypothetical protein
MPPVSEPDSVPEDPQEGPQEDDGNFYQNTTEEAKPAYHPEAPAGMSLERMQEVARQMEERRKERMKTLTRNLEVCDLLDIRNP